MIQRHSSRRTRLDKAVLNSGKFGEARMSRGLR